MTAEQIIDRINDFKKVMEQNPDNIQVIIHCGNKILDLEEQLKGKTEKPIVYLPPK